MYASVLLFFFAGVVGMNSDITYRSIDKEAVIDASLDAVWSAWTTDSGIKTFFGRDGNVELRPDGHYEIFFFPDNEPGMRGAEGTRILIVEPKKRLVFTWDAPPKWPDIRSQRTVVEVRLCAEGPDSTRVQLHHTGWGNGDDWAEVYDYFDAAWGVILRRLQYSFEHGPVDWDNRSDELVHRG